MQTTGSDQHEAGERAGVFWSARDTSLGSEAVRCVDDRLGALISASHRAGSRAELFRTFATGVASGLAADLTQVLEFAPESGDLLLRAGHGFCDDLCDRVRVPAGLLSQAGRAMLDPTGSPVSLGDFSEPHEWAVDYLLREHDARSGIVVRISTRARGFGTLGAYYRNERHFSLEDERFLVRAADLLGSEIERLERGEEAISWRSRSDVLRSGVALLKVPAEADAFMSAAALAAVSGGAGESRPLADWCFADALDADGVFPRLRRVAVDQAEGVSEKLEEAFSAPLEPTAPHGAPRAYATRQAELVERTDSNFIATVARDLEHRRALEAARPYSYMCAPVLGRECFHGALGFLRVETGTPEAYSKEDLEVCAEFAALVGEAIDRSLPPPEIEDVRDEMSARNTSPEVAHTEPTAKERQVLDLIAEGKRIGEITNILYMSERTVRTHKMHLCQKLGIKPKHGAARLIAESTRRGWITL